MLFMFKTTFFYDTRPFSFCFSHLNNDFTLDQRKEVGNLSYYLSSLLSDCHSNLSLISNQIRIDHHTLNKVPNLSRVKQSN